MSCFCNIPKGQVVALFGNIRVLTLSSSSLTNRDSCQILFTLTNNAMRRLKVDKVLSLVFSPSISPNISTLIRKLTNAQPLHTRAIIWRDSSSADSSLSFYSFS